MPRLPQSDDQLSKIAVAASSGPATYLGGVSDVGKRGDGPEVRYTFLDVQIRELAVSSARKVNEARACM